MKADSAIVTMVGQTPFADTHEHFFTERSPLAYDARAC